jgi:hypothetical protein
MPEIAHARNTDPQTSHAAAVSVDDLTEKQSCVLAVFNLASHTAGADGLTDEELIEMYYNPALLNVQQSESGIRTRRSELVTKCKIKDSGVRRKTKAGRQSIVWTLA